MVEYAGNYNTWLTALPLAAQLLIDLLTCGLNYVNPPGLPAGNPKPKAL